MKSIISLSTEAYKQLFIIAKENNTKNILFYIKSGGCNGFEYKFKPIDEIENVKNSYKKNELNIEVCNKSLLYVLGTKIDWKNDIMGSYFSFDNPVSKMSCGCGTSFSV
tara:strand:- start:1483 stop:1809 length:327 start_codon:yes stop_codon:yes gene_type:complete